MNLLGVTGGIGMGKSAVAQTLGRQGVAVVDTDDLSRQLTQPGQPALAEIAKAFGPSCLREDGSLNRAALAGLVFHDDSARAQLEGILHPAIRAAWLTEVERWRKAGRMGGAVVIPLLFETGAQCYFDATLCVACSAATQKKRLAARGWTDEQIASRNAAQWPVEKKIGVADFVIWTDMAPEVTAAQLEKIIDTAGRLRRTPACA